MHDVAVVGAGCIGASIAKHLAQDGHSVVVLDKEPRAAMHQSGRNSGVVHAGYNLKPGSQKARFCVEGNRAMRTYCMQRGVPFRDGGALVVARQEHQRAALATLHAQGRANDVPVSRVDADGLRAIEPAAAGIEALHAPSVASVDARAYVEALVADARAHGATFLHGVRVRRIEPGRVVADQAHRARLVINAAGLHADRLAGDVSEDLRIVPFRGAYANVIGASAALVRSHIYAAPDPDLPFLGVHLSRHVDGAVAAGPSAMWAFGREAYRFWSLHGGGLGASLAWPGFWRLLASAPMRRSMRRELAKAASPRAVWKEARALVPDLRAGDLRRGTAGNRAQLVDRRGHLVDDLIVRRGERSLHVLNAVSPGLTCSLPFGRHVARMAEAT